LRQTDALARGLAIAALLATLMPVGGCAAAKSSLHLVAADNALSRARARDADQAAPYEYTMATRYLDKAREEFGEADYRVAEALSRACAKWADQAIITMEQRGPSIDMGTLSDDGNDAAAPEPEPEPAPVSGSDEPIDPLFEPATEGPVVAPAPEAEAPAEPAEEDKGEFDELENLDPDDEEEGFEWDPQ
jgi:hypothetical protein